MGLAPYGNENAQGCRRMIEIIKSKLVDIKEDGSIFCTRNISTMLSGSGW